MNEKALRVFRSLNDSGNCCEASNSLARKLAEGGCKPTIRRVAHKSNVFGDNSCLLCEHVCGESYVQHLLLN